MAKVSFNQLLEAFRGRIKGLVVRQRPDGTYILSGAPRYKKGKGSPKQKAYRAHFRKQARKARELAKIHPIYAELAAAPDARGKWLSAYNFALADCLKPPVIHRIERTEGCIRVEATDNILVSEVHVTLKDETGKVLETGQATRAADDWWEFPTQITGVTIIAQAFDLAQNVTEFVL